MGIRYFFLWMVHTHAKIKHREYILKLQPDTITVSSSAIVFKLGQQIDLSLVD